MLKRLLFILMLWLTMANAGVLHADDGKYRKYEAILKLHIEDTVKSRLLINYISYLTDTLEDYDLALLICSKVNSMLDQKDNTYQKVQLYYYWSLNYYWKGNYMEADKINQEALLYKPLEQHLDMKARILLNAGSNLRNMRVLKRAMTYYNQALEILIKTQNKKGLASAYWNMANMMSDAGQYTAAFQFLEKSTKIFRDNNLIKDYGNLLLTRANIESRAKRPDSSILLLQRYLKLPYTKKEERIRASAYLAVGKNYAELDLYDTAFYYLARGKQYADSVGAIKLILDNYYFAMAYSYDLKGNYEKAIYFYKEASKLRTGKTSVKSLYENIADDYLELKQYDSAFAYKDAAIQYADTLYANEIREHTAFENKRIELLENDYKDQIRSAAQQRSLEQLEKKNYILIGAVLVLIIGVLLFYIYFRQYSLRIKKEHLQSELDFLKAQLNPHFLFNSINNIYVLIDENKERASAILLKFSELMRYQLYECNVSAIQLSKEMQFLENYIEFEKLRYSNKITVQYMVQGDVAHNLMIAPLLLQPFLENAFKHTPKKKDSQSRIDVHISVNGSQLLFEVINSANSDNNISELPGGIGLNNVKKRLKLLYSGLYDLQIKKTDQQYSITLKLTLAYD